MSLRNCDVSFDDRSTLMLIRSVKAHDPSIRTSFDAWTFERFATGAWRDRRNTTERASALRWCAQSKVNAAVWRGWIQTVKEIDLAKEEARKRALAKEPARSAYEFTTFAVIEAVTISLIVGTISFAVTSWISAVTQ